MHRLLGSRLANLLLQSLAGVADALLFVRIWRTQSAHIGGNLSHFLAIDSANGQPRLLGIDGHGDAIRQRKLDGMGIAQREYHRVLALQLRAITDADNFQFLGPALGHALDVEFHSLWERNRFVSNSGHTVKSFYDLNFFE